MDHLLPVLPESWILNWALLIGVFGIAVISPGPDFVIAVRNSLVSGRLSGICTAFGFALGVSIHITYVMIGLAAIIAQSILLFTLIKYAGAAYLFYMGVQALRSKGFSEHKESSPKTKILSPLQSLASGFLTNILNPKATLFFLAVFSQFIGPDTTIAIKTLFGLTCFTMTFLWFSAVALFLTHPYLKSLFMKAAQWIDRICGTALIALGLRLALTTK